MANLTSKGDDKETKFCFLCQTPCNNICGYCKLVAYCSEDHFKLHRVIFDDREAVSIQDNFYKSQTSQIMHYQLVYWY